MKKIILTLFVINSIFFACNQSQNGNTNTVSNADPNPAMNHPDSIAWQLFIEVNKPADIKTPNGPATWEKFALASDVYKDPLHKPQWDSVVNAKKTFKDFEPLPLQQQMRFELQDNPHMSDFQAKFIPNELAEDSTSDETRFNKVVFDFVADSGLYYVEGQEAYMQKLIKQNRKIDLPIAAKEVKAQWRRINIADTSIYHFNTITVTDSVTQKKEIQYWGLVSMHIISKDLPQWTWATFEHEKNPGLIEANKNQVTRSVDSYGKVDGKFDGKMSKALLSDFKKNNMPEKWKHYILRGTQTNYTDFMGNPTHLANTYVEDGFVRTSSCITCHSRATIGVELSQNDFQNTVNQIFETRKPMYKRDSTGKIIRELTNEEYVGKKEKFIKSINTDETNSNSIFRFANRLSIFKTFQDPGPFAIIEANNGIPNPDWYKDVSGQQVRLQTDFMWSFFRAKRRTPYQPVK